MVELFLLLLRVQLLISSEFITRNDGASYRSTSPPLPEETLALTRLVALGGFTSSNADGFLVVPG